VKGGRVRFAKLPIIINVGTKPPPSSRSPNVEYTRASLCATGSACGEEAQYNELSRTDFGFADLPIIIDPMRVYPRDVCAGASGSCRISKEPPSSRDGILIAGTSGFTDGESAKGCARGASRDPYDDEVALYRRSRLF